MRAHDELINYSHPVTAIPPSDEVRGVSRKTMRVAGGHHHHRHIALAQDLHLRLGAGAWRVQNHGIKLVAFRARQRGFK